MNTTAELTVVDTKLEQAIAQSGLEPQSAQGLLEKYKPLFAQANELVAAAQSIAVTDATQVSEIKRARNLRLQLRAIRIEAEKTRKGLKEDSLRRGKAIDGVYNVLEYAIAPVESRLLEMEEFAERAEAARKAALKSTREELLKPFGVDASIYPLGDLSEDAFKQLLDGSRLAHEAKLAAAKKAEEERIAREKAEAEERERIRIENERLKEERERLEAERRAEREKAEAERRAIEEKARAEREAAEQARRVAEEEARKLREAEEARKRKEAEERARIEREEREAKAKVEAERRKAEAAPDVEKVRTVAKTVRAIPVPVMATDAGKAKAKELADKIEQFAAWIERRAAELEAAQ